MSAGLKQMKEHVSAVKSIQKITHAMKVVSAAKFAKYEKSLRLARPLGVGANYFYVHGNFQKELVSPSITCLAITSDRGLCGSMHSKVCKAVKSFVNKLKHAHDVVCIGEKAKGILQFEMSHTISLVVNGVGHRAPTFIDAAQIAIFAFKRKGFAMANIFYPKFRNMVSFEIEKLFLYSLPVLSSGRALLSYDVETDEQLLSYIEFSQCAILYYSLCETFLVESSARIMAMSSASKNASAMNKRLELELHRKRQQVITNELIDIVSGAQVIVGK